MPPIWVVQWRICSPLPRRKDVAAHFESVHVVPICPKNVLDFGHEK
jgi:hypothetical protein